jgi:HK97 family phage portal protein
MTIGQRIKGLFGLGLGSGQAKSVNVSQSQMLNNQYNTFGDDMGESIRKGYMSNGNVYAIVNRINAQAIKGEICLYKEKGTKIEEVEKHAFLDLMNRPNPTQGWAEYIENISGFYSVCGEVFVHFVTAEQGINATLPIESWVINTYLVKKINYEAGLPVSYEVGEGAYKVTLPANEVVHLKSFNPDPQSNRGLSPIQAAKYLVTQNSDSYKAQSKLLQNIGASGILTVSQDNNVTFGKEQAEALQASYYEKYGGADNYGKLVITPAAMTWQQIGMSAVDLNILESQKMTLRDLCNVFNMPSVLMNDAEHSTYNNVKEARKDLISQVVLPLLNRFISQVEVKILPLYEKKDKADYYLQIDTDGFEELNADLAQLSTTLAASWWLTPNERREVMGYDKAEDEAMDKIYIPTGTTPIDMAGMDGEI